MRVLFDQGTPVPLRDYLAGHTIGISAELGWSRLRNGDLLAAAEEAGSGLLLTTDKNIRYQQNLKERTPSGPRSSPTCSEWWMRSMQPSQAATSKSKSRFLPKAIHAAALTTAVP